MTAPAFTNCDFCGKAVPVAAEAHIGERQCCEDCRKRLSGNLCAACNGTGSACACCGKPCAICHGEGLKFGAPCPFTGPMTCDCNDCVPCAERLVGFVDDRNDARREEEALRSAGDL